MIDEPSSIDTQTKNTRIMRRLVFLVLTMIGLSFASVPLYSLFCQVTGFGGTTQEAETLPSAQLDRTVRVLFNAGVDGALPWEFRPEIRSTQVHLGEGRLMAYSAKNRSDMAVAGTALYNVTPEKAGKYFTKVQCFCFNEQWLEAGQQVDMPVYFFVDPAMSEDPNMDDVKTITLSYTFYPAESDALAGAMERYVDGKGTVTDDELPEGWKTKFKAEQSAL